LNLLEGELQAKITVRSSRTMPFNCAQEAQGGVAGVGQPWKSSGPVATRQNAALAKVIL
jgi:hypothetical protein